MAEDTMQEILKMIKMAIVEAQNSYNRSPYKVGYEEYDNWEEMIPSNDGIKLRTIFYKPKGKSNETFPAVVERCCYPIGEEKLKVNGPEMAKRGITYVYQACRGTGGSEGTWEPNVNERDDGKALLDYLNEIPWIESIGLYGYSYSALAIWALADILPEKVKSLFISNYGTDRFSSAYKDGLFRQDILTSWAMKNTGFKVTSTYEETAKYRPQAEVDEALWGRRVEWYRDLILKPNGNDPYWQQGFWAMLRDIPEKLRSIPIYIGEGWYDHHLGSALNGCTRLSQEALSKCVIRIGPWNHGGQTAIKGHSNQKNGYYDETSTVLEWFMKTLRSGKAPEHKVEYYNIGADEWKVCDSYPFHEDKKLEFFLGYGKLASCQEENGMCQYVYNPEDPIITHGAESLLESNIKSGGSILQSEPNWRDDVISFVSEPLTCSVDILGKIKVKLFVESDAEDTCFAIKLMEVFENGEAYNIRNGITTLAYRNGSQTPVTYNGGEVEIEIDTWDIAWRLQKGSRLRLDVMSSNFPEYSVHPNIAGIWSEITETKIAHQIIHFGRDHASRVILPIKA